MNANKRSEQYIPADGGREMVLERLREEISNVSSEDAEFLLSVIRTLKNRPDGTVSSDYFFDYFDYILTTQNAVNNDDSRK